MRSLAQTHDEFWQDGGPVASEAALCHDLRQPVAAILLLASSAADDADGDGRAVRERLRLIQDQAAEIAKLIDAALERRAPAAAAEQTEADAVAEAVVVTVRLTHPGHVALVRGAPGARVPLSGPTLRRVLANLVDNAARAAGNDGLVRVSTRRSGGQVVVDVEDDGPGWGRIPDGHGIGLRFATEAVASCGGSLSARRMPAGRTRVTLRLPAVEPGE